MCCGEGKGSRRRYLLVRIVEGQGGYSRCSVGGRGEEGSRVTVCTSLPFPLKNSPRQLLGGKVDLQGPASLCIPPVHGTTRRDERRTQCTAFHMRQANLWFAPRLNPPSIVIDRHHRPDQRPAPSLPTSGTGVARLGGGWGCVGGVLKAGRRDF